MIKNDAENWFVNIIYYIGLLLLVVASSVELISTTFNSLRKFEF